MRKFAESEVPEGRRWGWAFLGDSDTPATMDYWKFSIIIILVERGIKDEAVVGLFDNGCVWAVKLGEFLMFTSRIT